MRSWKDVDYSKFLSYCVACLQCVPLFFPDHLVGMLVFVILFISCFSLVSWKGEFLIASGRFVRIVLAMLVLILLIGSQNY